MHTAVSSAVRLVFEAHFADGAELVFKTRNRVLAAVAVRDQAKLGILGGPGSFVAGVGNEEASRASQGRLRVTGKTLVGVVAGAKSVGVGMELGENRVEFALIGDGRAVGDVGAIVAGGLELAGAQNAFGERCQLVVVDSGA